MQSIFGKDKDNKWIAYATLVNDDNSIKTFNKGTICMNKRRFQVKKRYQLPVEFIEAIFADKELLEKVCDAGSDYYTDRQRRLIFTQINDKKKGYHYKTKEELAEEMTEQERIDAVLADFDLD